MDISSSLFVTTFSFFSRPSLSLLFPFSLSLSLFREKRYARVSLLFFFCRVLDNVFRMLRLSLFQLFFSCFFFLKEREAHFSFPISALLQQQQQPKERRARLLANSRGVASILSWSFLFFFLPGHRHRRRGVPGGRDLVPGGQERARGRARDDFVLDRERGAGRGARGQRRRVRRQRAQRQLAQVRVVARERVLALGGQLAERGLEFRRAEVAPPRELRQRRPLLGDAPLGAVDRAALVGVERREQRAGELEPDAVARARAVGGAQDLRELRQRRVEHLVLVRAGALGRRDRRRRRRAPARGAGGRAHGRVARHVRKGPERRAVPLIV